jgi:hypothetical protein
LVVIYGSLTTFRLKLKAKVRHLRRSPGNVDRQTIQSEREELSALFQQLKHAQQSAGVAEPNSSIVTLPDSGDSWDDLAFDPVPVDAAKPVPVDAAQRPSRSAAGKARAEPLPVVGKILIEDQIITLPSNGNASNIHRQLELAHRIDTAEDILNQIRNLIAEKSFQFSHVIRVSPRKGVTTRSRAAVKKLNNEIAEHGRMYARCRSCLLILGAEDSILSQFKVLNPEDVGASTAVLKPNTPGSTSIKLSWIWETSARHILGFPGSYDPIAEATRFSDSTSGETAEDLRSLFECMFLSFYYNNIFIFS